MKENSLWGAPLAVILIALLFVLVLGGVPATLLGARVLRRTGSRRRAELLRPAAVKAGTPQALWVDSYLSGTRRWRLAGLLVGSVLGISAQLTGATAIPWALFGPAVGYLVGVLGGELAAPQPLHGDVRSASLTTRRPATYLVRWVLAVSVVGAGLLILAPVLFAVAPRISYHAVCVPNQVVFSGRLAWPSVGWSSAVAVIGLAGLGLSRLVIRRVVGQPESAEGDGQSLDDLCRRSAVRSAEGAGAALVLLAVGLLSMSAAGGLEVPCSHSVSALSLASGALGWAGLGVVVAAITLWFVLEGSLGRHPSAASQPGPGEIG